MNAVSFPVVHPHRHMRDAPHTRRITSAAADRGQRCKHSRLVKRKRPHALPAHAKTRSVDAVSVDAEVRQDLGQQL